jgi:predicted aminopeptidase
MNIDLRFTIFTCLRSGAIQKGGLALVKAAALLAAAGIPGGCETLGYYAQAVNGHAQLMHRARDIPDMLDDPSVSEERRRKLRQVLAIRDFASSELSLPDNGSYRKFADLGGEAVVWALVATPEFSVDPLQWCYPVIGCAAYRGYFDRDDALAAGLELARQGRDWTAEPVPAYSTLGWFDDPLPGSVLGWDPARLAGLVFHELAHQKLYLAGDSTFNESFASAVEHAGVQRWLEQRGDTDALSAWRRRERRYRQFVDLLLDTRERLQTLYRQPLPVSQLRRAKREELDRMGGRYRQLSAAWGSGGGFDGWFEQPVNNARLALVGTYQQWRPAFLELLCRHQGDFAAFYRTAQSLADLPPEQRQRDLQQLMRQARDRDQGRRRSCP